MSAASEQPQQPPPKDDFAWVDDTSAALRAAGFKSAFNEVIDLEWVEPDVAAGGGL